jgi:hypothetical protein
MTRHHDSQAIWFLSIPGRFSKSSLTHQSHDTILLEGLRRESLYNRSFFLPPGFLSELATTLLLGSEGECSVVSLAWSDAAFLTRLPSLSSTNVRYTIWDWLSFQSYWIFVLCACSCFVPACPIACWPECPSLSLCCGSYTLSSVVIACHFVTVTRHLFRITR